MTEHFLISGMVQGVGFRSTVKRFADAHKVKGFVRNLPDGKVEICAQGAEEHVEAFLENLHREPGLARIDQVERKGKKEGEKYSSFKILH